MQPSRLGNGAVPLRARYGGLAVAVWLVIGVATLTPTPASTEQAAATPLACLVCGEAGSVDIFWNLLLFVPLGFALRRFGCSLRIVIGLAALTTITVETLQLLIVPGRDPSLSDVLSNTIGGGAGAALARALPAIWRPAPARFPAFLLASTAAPIVVLAGSAVMLQPSPPATLWYGHRAPDLGQFEQFLGSVDSAWIGGTVMPHGPMYQLDTRRIRESGAPPPVGALFRSGPSTPGLAPIAFVSDEKRKVFLLAQDGRNLQFEARIRGEDYRLRGLGVSLQDALPDTVGVVVLAWGEFDGRVVTAKVVQSSGTREMRVPVTPGLGWILLAPARWSATELSKFISAAWLLGLWVPLGFYSRRATLPGTPMWKAAAGLALVSLAAAAAVPTVGLVYGLGEGSWTEWLSSAAGVPIGAVFARAT